MTGECEVLFDFDGDVANGELVLRKGDIITTTEWVDKEWMRGKVGGQTGMFPINFVKIIKELPKSSSKPGNKLSRHVFMCMSVAFGYHSRVTFY